MKQYGALNSEVVLYSYSLGLLYLLGITLVTGELLDALGFFFQNPTKTFGYVSAVICVLRESNELQIAILSFTGYFGLNIVLDLVSIPPYFPPIHAIHSTNNSR